MVDRLATFCISRRNLVMVVLLGLTVVLGLVASGLRLETVFSDLLPADHPYIKTNDEFKETFGGSNIVSIMIKAKEGDIFQLPVLEKIQKVTYDLQYVPAVNQFQIISLASRKIKEIKASTGGIETAPMMWPDLPSGPEGVDSLREAVLANPLVYGRYVSPDLKSALITVDFIDRLIDYDAIYAKISSIVESVEDDSVEVMVVGEPILTGYVHGTLHETFIIVLLTIATIALILFVTVRTIRGVLLPLISGSISASWALGLSTLLGINFDPLVIVIAFLISARVISHSVQLAMAFDDEVARGENNCKEAGRKSLDALFRPGMLGVLVDAGAMIVVALIPIPLLQKAAFIGTIWVGTIAVSAVILTPVMLSYTRDPHAVTFPLNTTKLIVWVLNKIANLVIGRGAYAIVLVAAVALTISGYYAFNITVGDANPGSPLLWPDSEYNEDATAINDTFQGSDRMFVVVAGDEPNTLKQPSVLANMERFQRYLEAQPEIGGTSSIVDLLEPVNASLHEGNMRFYERGDDAMINGELVYMYLSSSDPGDIDRFSDPQYTNGAVTAYFRDHKGETIRVAVSRIKKYIEDNPLEGAHYRLAGGLIGVLAAVNEEIFAGQVESIALALLVLFIFAAIAYKSTVAGLFFMPLVLLSNAITFTYMYFNDIGMNINTLPVAALGIGLGVDYAFYIVDGVKERFEESGDVVASIRGSMLTAGRGVFVTGATMIASVLLWTGSSLRFQAEMGLLIALWLTVSAFSSLFLIPSMIYLIRPRFVFESDAEETAKASPQPA